MKDAVKKSDRKREAPKGGTISAELLEILDEVTDPEIPVLTVRDLGIVRDAVRDDEGVTVTITPTYSGCPAMHEIEQAITAAFVSHGYHAVRVRTVYSPAWTSDWISDEGRVKLEAYGIAAPAHHKSVEQGLVAIATRRQPVCCPYCRSTDTERRSEFGSTACKAIWFCRACTQPFEEFKAI